MGEAKPLDALVTRSHAWYSRSRMKYRLAPESPLRRLAIALAVYIVCGAIFAFVAGPERLTEHTAYNHYALLADAWIHGRHDLPRGPPPYSQNNDFAEFGGKTYISFPPFPALLMLPFVKVAGTPENFRDGQFVVWLAGLGPAFLFLVLEKVRRTGRSRRSEAENAVAALLFAFGSVYFFTAVEGTVWFAALVVGVALQALYVLFSLDAHRPLLAGAALACAYMTRPPILLSAPFFALEALRVSCAAFPSEGTLVGRLRAAWQHLDKMAVTRKYVVFALPILLAFGISSFLNHARYLTWSPFDPGHEYLTVAWRARMMKWGVLSYHYLSKNLGVMLTILPWLRPKGVTVGSPFQINEHGLALWFTTPLYLWLFRPRRRGFLYNAVLASAIFPMLMDLLYQNTGWRQFGYRFSNDYAILLFVLLALGECAMGWFFRFAAIWSMGWNLFGAITFDRAAYDRFYYRDPSQTVLYQPD
jgi:hypothetical protein